MPEKNKVSSNKRSPSATQICARLIFVLRVAKSPKSRAQHRLLSFFQRRKQLKKASKFISTLSTFQEDLQPVVEGFKNICNADKSYNLNSIKALGDLMVKLSDQFGEVNGGRGRQYVDNVVVGRLLILFPYIMHLPYCVRPH